MSAASEHSDESDAKALAAVLVLADRWADVLAECKQADPRWITDRSVTVLDGCLSELRYALRPVLPPGKRAE